MQSELDVLGCYECLWTLLVLALVLVPPLVLSQLASGGADRDWKRAARIRMNAGGGRRAHRPRLDYLDAKF